MSVRDFISEMNFMKRFIHPSSGNFNYKIIIARLKNCGNKLTGR